MNLRPLGRSGIAIAPLVLGGNVFGWNTVQQTSSAILDAFVDAGFNAIDTADSYSRWAPGHVGGESELVIGRWLKQSGKRDKVVIATKVGSDMGEGKCVRKDYILRAAEGSLRRLGVETIDLYQTHFDDEVTPVEETLEAYGKLIGDGKVRAVGASNIAPARLKASLDAAKTRGLPRYESLQPLYNVYDRKAVETELAPILREHGLGLIPYYGLAAGFLTGKYRSLADAEKNPSRGGRVKNYLTERGFAVLKALDSVSARHNATPAQVALAWLIAQPIVTAPIASATSLAQLNDIMKAPRLKLTADDLKVLDVPG
jgi:aryl-alcohol dehydrogenase-like predicted oxidoreductase